MQTELNIPTRKSDHKLHHIGNSIHISESGLLYETSKREVEPDSLIQNGTSGKPWARWGHDNNYPQRLIDTVKADPSATLLEKVAAFHWGGGMMFYNQKIDGNKIVIEPVLDEKVDSEITDFMFRSDWPNFMQGIIADYTWWHSHCTQYITNPFGKILEVKWQRRKDVRPELRNPDTGKIDNYYLSGYWPMPNDGKYSKVAAFDRLGNGSGLYEHKLVDIDKDYFPQPGWHGITQFLHIAKKIPRWILANIDNSINLKYHVKIPLAYFMARHPEDMYKTSAERNKAIQDYEAETYKKIDAYLAGEKNVHKAFYSKVAIDDQGKVLPGWEILPIANEIKDEAWLRAYGTASMAIISGIGLSPSIAGSILPNGLGSGSGSDLREQFNFYMQVMTSVPRQTTLEPWEIIKRRNGWPKDLHLGFKDVVLQSTDQNKSGFAKQNESSPTSDKTDTSKNSMTV